MKDLSCDKSRDVCDPAFFMSSSYFILHSEIMGAVLNLNKIFKNAIRLGIDCI